MQELKVVKVDRLDPNPWRDSSGSATWETVAEVYGFDEEKLKELQDSYATNGVWAGVHVRPIGGRYQLAFGHHRIEAARRMGVPTIPVVVVDLSDDKMLKMMASENSEEYGHDFRLGVMNAVEAVIKAYGAGAIELEQPDPKTPPPMLSLINGKRFTQSTVGTYLGWVSPKDGRPADKVRTAVAALELIELGALKRNQFKGLGAGQARELVTIARRGMQAEAEKQTQQQEFLESQKQKALKDDDKNKANRLTKQLAQLVNEKDEHIKNAARAVASSVVSFHKESESFAEASRKAVEAHKLPEKPSPKKKLPLDTTYVDNFRDTVDNWLLDTDASFQRICEFSYLLKARKPFNQLAESFDRLAERARLRAKELRKVVG